jgi:FtsP/CotA-like multicopper oxidase with cupredoxin domain
MIKRKHYLTNQKESPMKAIWPSGIPTLALGTMLFAATPVLAQVDVQCPGDGNGDAKWDNYCSQTLVGGCTNNGDCPGGGNQCIQETQPANTECMSLTGGDGFATMADGRVLYTFSFSDVTGVPAADVMTEGLLAAAWPAPVIAVDQGEDFYLTLTNVGMLMRPDLFDPHTVHFHGFPNASSVFDGLPESAIAINMGASLTYSDHLVEPGTFMYHCHVEATEHMQMGMLGNLYVRPIQNRLRDLYCLSTGIVDDPACPADDVHHNPDYNPVLSLDDPLNGDKYVYNDGDGSTRYDVEVALQLGGFDHVFHEEHVGVQPLPFWSMFDTYPMINGRGYPDTVNPNALPGPDENGNIESQKESSLITAIGGQKILIRLSNLNITVIHTLISPSIPMEVVGIDSRELRTEDGTTPIHYKTNSYTLGGGMAADLILDTTGIDPGTYYLYAANLNYLSNYQEDFGGMMTEIVIN